MATHDSIADVKTPLPWLMWKWKSHWNCFSCNPTLFLPPFWMEKMLYFLDTSFDFILFLFENTSACCFYNVSQCFLWVFFNTLYEHCVVFTEEPVKKNQRISNRELWRFRMSLGTLRSSDWLLLAHVEVTSNLEVLFLQADSRESPMRSHCLKCITPRLCGRFLCVCLCVRLSMHACVRA